MKNYIRHLQPVLIFKSALIKKLLPGMTVITAVTACLILLHFKYDIINFTVSAALPGYMGAVLGLLLVFRNNSAYDRWWEARKEIGSLVNTCRNILLMLNCFLESGNPARKDISRMILAFIDALKNHLRQGVTFENLSDLTDAEKKIIIAAGNKPLMIVHLIINKIEQLYKNKNLTDLQQFMLVDKSNAITDILGRCERIRNTPIPMAYGFLLKFFINMYAIFLPLSLLNELSWWCLPLVMVLYYLMMSIVLTAEEIEEPFGGDLNDISMDQISETIKSNVREILAYE